MNFNEVFFPGSKPSAVIAQLGLRKVGSSWGPSYHNALHPWRSHHAAIQSAHGGHAAEALLPGSWPRRAAATVFGLLSELRVPVLIITSVFREELRWPLPTAFSPVLITSAPNFLPLCN